MGDEQLLKKDGEWYGCEEVWRGTMGADTVLMREGLVMAKGGGGLRGVRSKMVKSKTV